MSEIKTGRLDKLWTAREEGQPLLRRVQHRLHIRKYTSSVREMRGSYIHRVNEG